MPRCAIFTEAGSKITTDKSNQLIKQTFGYGHLERMKFLAKSLQKWTIKIYVHGDGIKECKEDSIAFEWRDFCQILESNSFNLIVIDSYLAKLSDYKLALKYATLMIIDDNARLCYPKDAFILNYALNSKKLYSRKNRLFCGVEYALLQKRDKEERDKEGGKISTRKRVLICMGGSDEANLTQKVATTLELNQELEQIYLLGAGYRHNLELKNAHAKMQRPLGKNEIYKLFSSVDFCILSGGVMMNEALAFGKCVLVIKSAKNQAFQINELEKFGAIIKVSIDELPFVIKSANLESISTKARTLPYGEKLAHAIKIIQKQALKIHSYNFTELQDETNEFILECRNAQREFMFNSEIISQKEHRDFMGALKLSDKKFFLITKGALLAQTRAALELKTIGVISLSIENEVAVCGLYKSPFYHSSAGQILISALEIEARKSGAKRVVLQVLENNLKAIKLYEKCKYELAKSEDLCTQSQKKGILIYEKSL